ncbi:hypothetical protein [Halovivax cerinus]|uniref:Uncharacterized protein n=1 Tax=Halovivax cerinus TaxID=1487865 RepID=A0ABD5NRG1_9EURY|nr:hypothetical protein [Halovivax cerinus]
MDDDTASRRSIVGLGALASFCCLGPGGAAVAGGTAATSGGAAVGLGAGVVEALFVGLAILLVGAAVRWRTGCGSCEASGA